ncbi:replicative DNA helicase [Streptomyces hygroscopicus]|uniref:replicative DNA helicase n=2 Tax=Streptomyces hygroscopicus TaxID=1912 RepID=UPI001FD195C6|nr:DnaB-like helicase C-terminal domain-containing protein [Streptomyces hygroscopicus]
MSLALWLSREGSIGGQTEEDSKEFIKQLMDLRQAAHNRQFDNRHTFDELPEEHGGETPDSSPHIAPPRQTRGAQRVTERKVLGCMLQSKDAIADVVESLEIDHFGEELHRQTYVALLDLYARGLEISVASVSGKLGDALSTSVDLVSYLHDLIEEAGDPVEAERYAKLVSDRALARRIGAIGRKLSDMAQTVTNDEAPDVDTLVKVAEEEVSSLVNERNAIGGIALEEALDEVEAASEAGSTVGVPSGFRDFDALNSGFRPGELVVVASAPGIGKSTLALNFIRECSVERSLATFLISLQMSRNEMTMRVLSAEAAVALHHMRSGMMTDDDWTRLARVMPSVNEAPMYMVDEPGYTIDQLLHSCERLRRFNGIQLVVIDSLDLLYVDPSKSAGSHERDLALIVRELRGMAKRLELPVVALYQMGRPPQRNFSHRPEVGDIPGCLENFADMLILLHREDAYEKESPRAGEADLIVTKNRNGPTAVINVAFQGHYSRFVDMAGP